VLQRDDETSVQSAFSRHSLQRLRVVSQRVPEPDEQSSSTVHSTHWAVSVLQALKKLLLQSAFERQSPHSFRSLMQTPSAQSSSVAHSTSTQAWSLQT
jgi:hypothetical protein